MVDSDAQKGLMHMVSSVICSGILSSLVALCWLKLRSFHVTLRFYIVKPTIV